MLNKFGFLREERIPCLIDGRVRSDGVAKETDGQLRDDGQSGCLHQLGELRTHERRAQQGVVLVVDDQFGPSDELVSVECEMRHGLGVVRSSCPHRETFRSGLMFRAPHPDELRVGEDDLRLTVGVACGELVEQVVVAGGPGDDDVGRKSA